MQQQQLSACAHNTTATAEHTPRTLPHLKSHAIATCQLQAVSWSFRNHAIAHGSASERLHRFCSRFQPSASTARAHTVMHTQPQPQSQHIAVIAHLGDSVDDDAAGFTARARSNRLTRPPAFAYAAFASVVACAHTHHHTTNNHTTNNHTHTCTSSSCQYVPTTPQPQLNTRPAHCLTSNRTPSPPVSFKLSAGAFAHTTTATADTKTSS